MKKVTIDLCVGSDIGRRALRVVPVDMVSRVFSRSEHIRLEATERGFAVSAQDLNHSEDSAADFAVSVHYPVILRQQTIRRYQKVYNLHPGFLPWGRGWYPVFWALFRGEPAGATLHEIDQGLDTGPIVKQISVPVEPNDDGRSLHQRVTAAEGELLDFLFKELGRGTIPPSVPQDPSKGSSHSKQDFYRWKRDPPLEELSPEKLLDLVRALSFPGYSGLELTRGESRFSVTMVPIDSDDGASSIAEDGRSDQS